jgi:hypothetical protein
VTCRKSPKPIVKYRKIQKTTGKPWQTQENTETHKRTTGKTGKYRKTQENHGNSGKHGKTQGNTGNTTGKHRKTQENTRIIRYSVLFGSTVSKCSN